MALIYNDSNVNETFIADFQMQLAVALDRRQNEIKISPVGSIETEVGNSIQSAYISAKQLFFENHLFFPDVFAFRGNGDLDGHALIVHNKPIAFIDLEVMESRYKMALFEPLTHLAHELIHAVHYHLSPEFSMQEVVKKENSWQLLKRTIAEGIATCLTRRLLGKSCDEYWFGLIQSSEVNTWKRNCEKFWNRDFELIKNKSSDTNIDIEFLSLSSFSMDDLLRGRRSYFHGTLLVEALSKEESIHDVLTWSLDDWLFRLKSFSLPKG